MALGIQKTSNIFEGVVFRSSFQSEKDKTLLAKLGFIIKRYPPQHPLIRQGEREDRTFIIESGWACLTKELAGGERQIADLALPGDVIGLRAEKAESHKSLVALTDLVVHEARPKSLLAAITQSETLAAGVVAAAARQRAILIEHMTNLGRRSAAARTGHFLLEIRARLQAAGMDAAKGYECPLTQYDLADALGLTAIHVNRMLRELREHGYLSFRHGVVEFFDAEGLAELCEFDPHYLT